MRPHETSWQTYTTNTGNLILTSTNHVVFAVLDGGAGALSNTKHGEHLEVVSVLLNQLVEHGVLAPVRVHLALRTASSPTTEWILT